MGGNVKIVIKDKDSIWSDDVTIKQVVKFIQNPNFVLNNDEYFSNFMQNAYCYNGNKITGKKGIFPEWYGLIFIDRDKKQIIENQYHFPVDEIYISNFINFGNEIHEIFSDFQSLEKINFLLYKGDGTQFLEEKIFGYKDLGEFYCYAMKKYTKIREQEKTECLNLKNTIFSSIKIDYSPWQLHCFLEQNPENMKNKISEISGIVFSENDELGWKNAIKEHENT